MARLGPVSLPVCRRAHLQVVAATGAVGAEASDDAVEGHRLAGLHAVEDDIGAFVVLLPSLSEPSFSSNFMLRSLPPSVIVASRKPANMEANLKVSLSALSSVMQTWKSVQQSWLVFTYLPGPFGLRPPMLLDRDEVLLASLLVEPIVLACWCAVVSPMLAFAIAVGVGVGVSAGVGRAVVIGNGVCCSVTDGTGDYAAL